MPPAEAPIACDLCALTATERVRESALLDEHLRAAVETRERDDGYSFRYPADAALFARMAELVSLEHRCCPFLDLALSWAAGAESSPWLHVTGGAGVKAFVGAVFVRRGEA